MSDALRVVIADEHLPTRESVREALERGAWVVLADVGSADEAIAAALDHRPDVCVLDIHMPGNGIVAAAEIASALPDTAVVMLTASGDDDDVFAALRAGASGYLTKDMDPDRLGPALRGVLAGEAVLPRRLVRRITEQFRSAPRRRIPLPGRPKPVELTEKETEVLDLMAAGLSTEEIGRTLFVAPVTVRTHVRSILRKLRVPDREAAIRVAREASGGC